MSSILSQSVDLTKGFQTIERGGRQRNNLPAVYRSVDVRELKKGTSKFSDGMHYHPHNETFRRSFVTRREDNLRFSNFSKHIDRSPGHDKLTRQKVKFLPELKRRKVLRQERSKFEIKSFR